MTSPALPMLAQALRVVLVPFNLIPSAMRTASLPATPRLFNYRLTHDALNLLADAGVQTFTELAQWNVAGLQHRLAQVHATQTGEGDAPPAALVASWIDHARRSTQAVAPSQGAPLARVRSLFTRLAS